MCYFVTSNNKEQQQLASTKEQAFSGEVQISPNLCSAMAQASQKLTLCLSLTPVEISQHLIGSLSIS